MTRWLPIVLVLVLASIASAAKLTCPGGVLASAQTTDGASANHFIDDAHEAAGFQMKLSAGTAIVSVQACCRDDLGSTGCDADNDWGDLLGCSASLDAAGANTTFCSIGPLISCRFRAFFTSCVSGSCTGDVTVRCSRE